MPALRPLKPREVIRTIERMDFRFISQKGSHAKYSHPDGRKLIVPVHSGSLIGRGLLREIFRQMGCTWEEFQKNL